MKTMIKFLLADKYKVTYKFICKMILQKLSVVISSPIFNSKSHRYLRISVENITIVTKFQAKAISDTQIEWDEKIEIPSLYNKQFQFEIFEKHQFGYNPEQLNNILSGTFIIRDVDERYNNWEVYDHNKQKLGYFSATITQKSLRKNNSPSPLAKNKLNVSSVLRSEVESKFGYVYINSIVAHLPSAQAKRAFTVIRIGERSVKTCNVKSRSGEIVFIEGYEIEKDEEEQQANFEVYSYDNRNNSSQLIALGQLKLDGQKPQKKVILYSKQGQIVGQMYVESKQAISKSLSYNPGIRSSRLASSKLRYSSNHDDSLSAYGIISPMKSASRLDMSTEYQLLSGSRVKKLSVVGRNNDIVFPKQKRFVHFGDKTTDVVSYLSQNSRDFRFLNQKTKRYYRGASLGYGSKADFTKASLNNPGVGRYKLPTIWDRY